MNEKIKNKVTLLQIADMTINAVYNIMQRVKTEEDLRIGFEKILEPVLESIGIKPNGRYERSFGGKSIYKELRPDAVHGQVIIEYEAPRSFSSKSKIERAHNQLIGYLSAESQTSNITKLIGVGFDGESIFFVRYKGKEDKNIDETNFFRQGPYAFNLESARVLLIYLRSLSRLPLTAENLSEKFGPKSKLAPKMVSALVDALENWGNPRTDVFLMEWKRLFGIVYGQFNNKGSIVLSMLYEVSKETDFQNLLFCIHTYFAILMKFIAAELITLKESSFSTSFIYELVHSSSTDELKFKLNDLEEGGIYAKRGITNFLEGDFFRWYLDGWSPRLEDAIKEITRGLSDFETGTSQISPESTRDLLKKLYQYLVPKEVRQKLGEYYTPDWLAELILDEVGYDGNTQKRILDPACGSGTFLVLAIQRAKNYGLLHHEPLLETLKRIMANIWGFDLNPLAVIASRTNYIFALGDLIHQLPYLEIPIYLADSVLAPTRIGNTFGELFEIKTSVKNFQIPAFWVHDKGFLLGKAAPLVEKFSRQGYSINEALDQFKKEGLVLVSDENVINNFYGEILDLERQGKNGIWAKFLKNAFAPIIGDKFDFVIGNPPWIRWGLLSQEYRKATLNLWQEYGLFSLKGHEARLGGGEKDFSMLFTYAAADNYLKNGAKLGFLITQEVYKSKGAGEGFRRFRLGDKDYLKVLKAHDLVSIQPFDKAANKTAAIIFKKGEPTTYPISYTLWSRKKGIGRIPTDIVLSEALPMIQRKELMARPIGDLKGSWQTISTDQEKIRVIEGKNYYQAKRGAETDPYGVFWLEIKQVLTSKDLIIRNLNEKGDRDIPSIVDTIESNLVFPGIRGSDINRWNAVPGIFLLVSQNPQKKEPYTEQQMKKQWPRTYGYLLRFKEILLARGSKPVKQLAERTTFYTMYGIGIQTFSLYKVIWKRMSNDLVAAVITHWKTPFGYKTIVPTGTTSFFATSSENEAHYICAIINSDSVREFVKSYSSAGRGFGTPSVMTHVNIPKFDSKNELHQKLAWISKKLHNLKEQGEEEKIHFLENQNNDLVNKLFNIK